MENISAQFLVLVPVVVGAVEALKKSGVSSKWAPLLSLVLGVVATYLVTGFVFSGDVVLQGVIVGLTAAGLYSGVRKTME